MSSAGDLNESFYRIGVKCVRVPEEVVRVQRWLLEDGRECGSLYLLVQGLVPRILIHDIPLDGVLMATYLIHPQLGAWHFTFESPDRYNEIPFEKASYQQMEQDAGPDAPFNQLRHGTADRVRIRIKDGDEPKGMESYFSGKDFTDAYIMPVHHRRKFVIGLCVATKCRGGWSDDHIEFFEGILPALGSTVQFLVNELVSYSLLCTYLGNDAGTRVYMGSVDRGDAVTVRSVIWFSDIRNYTGLSLQMDRDNVIALVNQVFEITEAAVQAHGGEILKFLGDGWMVSFSEHSATQKRRTTIITENRLPPLNKVLEVNANEEEDTGGPGVVLCQQAKAAAIDFQRRIFALRKLRSEKGLPGPHVGVGLHYGDCSYGNVGAPSRFDFTVIGPAVNLCSRVESLCRTLDANVLGTKEFVRLEGDVNSWDCKGEHTVKGVDKPVSVFELKATSQYETGPNNVKQTNS